MSNYYSFALIAAALTSSAIGYLAWRRREAPGALPLFLMLVTTVIWAGGYGFFLEADTPGTRAFWFHFYFVGAVWGTPAFLAFALQYTGREQWLTRRNIVLMSIVPALAVLLEWTNDWHHLFYSSQDLTTPLSSGGWETSPGIAYNLYLAYAYPVVLYTSFVIARAFFRSPRLYRGRAGAILFGTLIPLTGNIVYNVVFGGPARGWVDPTPVLFTVQGMFFAYGLFSFRLFEIVPMARHILVEHMTDGILVVDSKYRIIDVNPTAIQLLGLKDQSLVGESLDQLPAEWARQIAQTDQATNIQTELEMENHEVRSFDLQIEPLLDGQNQTYARLVVFRDITETKKNEDQLRKLSRAVEASAVAVVITNKDGRIEYVNPYFSKLTGYAPEEVVGDSSKLLESGITPSETYRNLWRSIPGGQQWEGEFVNKRKNGELYNEFSIIAPIVDNNGTVTHYVAIKQDISHRRRAEESLQTANRQLQSQLAEIESLQAILREQAIRDGLTGLYNRRHLDESLRIETDRAKRHGHPFGVLMIEIDFFKKINDTHGHEAGDYVLQKISELIQASTRTGDIACRYGGDEFVMILPETICEAACKCAERLREDISNLNLQYSGKSLEKITISIGVANYPQHGESGEAALKAADKAMYQAKESGKNRVETASMEQSVD